MDIMSKASVYGNPFIGIFSRTNDNVTVVGNGVSDKFLKHIDVLRTEIIKVPMSNCDLIGIYSVMNNNGIIFSPVLEEKEMKRFQIKTGILDTKFNAVGNNIVANDNGAIVNPDMEDREVKKIKDVLDVEIVKSTIAGYKTVGSVVLATNKGFVANPKTTPEELEMMSSLFRVSGGLGTANTGVPFVGISILANSKGFVIGEKTTGFESHRINDCLGFI